MEEKILPKFVLPSPKFDRPNGVNKAPHLYLTPSGMTLLPRAKQPPPMYGARGSTVPAKYLTQDQSSPVSVPETPPIYKSPPRSEYCHTCCMELATSEDMKRHLEQHESCPADDCDFESLHNILERHIEANHITGAYKKVKKVWTQEELAAWKAERRKRFPTAANVELARLAKEQRIKRGERLEASKSRFGNREDRQRTRPKGDKKERFDPKNRKKRNAKGKATEKKKNVGSSKKSTDKTNQSRETSTQSTNLNKECEETKDEDRNLIENAKFCGTGHMTDYQHFNKKNQKKDNALFGLLGMYGSDSEEESETEGENQDQDEAKQIIQEKTTLKSSKTESSKPTEKDPIHDNTDLKLEPNLSIDNYSSEASTKPVPIQDMETREDFTSVTENTSFLNEVPQEDINEITESGIEKVPPTREDHCSSDEAPNEEPFQRVTEAIRESSPPKTEPKECQPQTAPKRIAPKRINGLNYKRARKQTQQNTMLSKLLESDIRHERNVLLQCVRHVCERNFFGIGQTTEKKRLKLNGTRLVINL
ncbi:nuclear fragile X mental retardation-interacting protein 1 [Drosophila rhopaloa]|uniref:FMR1-interacting protein 1 conserved domain-containing protein n=1 Tax=Drosophila rhopaloa TaxID=1041015 RepID=A0ABM5HDZ9_DRORH|nr:nuclear fragile X mental retardation-interacting protein 1 [Drosophila rhopaloa]